MNPAATSIASNIIAQPRLMEETSTASRWDMKETRGGERGHTVEADDYADLDLPDIDDELPDAD